MHEEDQPHFVVIPPEKLSEEAFEALLDEFLLREGTDYGSVELSLDAKRARALKQIEQGHAQIVYSPENQSCTIIKASELPRLEEEYAQRQGSELANTQQEES
ncbi:MAG: YheU family protein [Bdellovibrionales bacterium]|nr:YheU family protein [Bdellovibrionales bacterium]